MKKLIYLLGCFCLLIAAPELSRAQYGTITTFAGHGSGGGFDTVGDGLLATAAKFSGISGMCMDAAGNIYVADSGHARIRKIHAGTNIITCIVGTGVHGFSGDGGPAPLAKIGYGVTGLAVDTAGNVYFSDSANHRIRKMNNTTGIISTIAGNGISGYSGDGGAATAASVFNPGSVCVDKVGRVFFIDNYNIRKVDTNGIISLYGGDGVFYFSEDSVPAVSTSIGAAVQLIVDTTGNLFFTDLVDATIHKIDTADIITTIAGKGERPAITWFYDFYGISGDGGIAKNALLTQPFGITMDLQGNIYFADYYQVVIRKIDAITGLISTVAGTTSYPIASFYEGVSSDSLWLYPRFIGTNDASALYYSRPYDSTVKKITDPVAGIRISSCTDSVMSASCTLPDTIGLGIYGIVNTRPSATDSAMVYVTFGDSSAGTTFYAHYWSYVDTAGDTIYGFGSHNSNLATHVYHYPGTFTPVFHITMTGGYNYTNTAPTLTVGLTCDPGITGINLFGLHDTVTTPPCTCQHTLFKYSGTVNGIPPTGDSVHILFSYGDGLYLFKNLPYVFNPSYGAYYFSDTLGYNYTDGNHQPEIIAVTSSGRYHVLERFHNIFTETCGCESPIDSTIGWIVPTLLDTVNGHTKCSLPYNDPYYNSGTELHWYAAIYDSVQTMVDFGDGHTAAFTAPRVTDGWGSYFFNNFDFSHSYTIPGTYGAAATYTAGIFSASTSVPPAIYSDECSALSGIFYIDANYNCIPDSGETRLSYWTYAIINNTTGDTTFGWTDQNGRYSRSYTDPNYYTIIANPTNALWAMHNTLYPLCPASGMDTFTTYMGATSARNFGFTCSAIIELPAVDTLHDLDMFASGMAWGLIPGDTGIVAVFAGDNWDYICNYLTTSVSLQLDPALTYSGMWDGPEPDSIIGQRLVWNFSTDSNLLEFYGDVKVAVSSSAHIGDSVYNTVYVAPTMFTDPDLTNNTYSWYEPIKSSWDPNEKQVSPKGLGTAGYVDNGTDLTYVVHFQNTGTAPATNIVVNDTMNTNIQVGSLEILASSAPVKVSQAAANVVQFTFSNINLPDSGSGRLQSQGYVTYRITPRPGLRGGSKLTNSAGIYFDLNPSVATNTTVNTIKDTLHLINGLPTVCVASSISLTDTNSGGAWYSTNGNATVDTNGVVTGINGGTDTISYTYTFPWGTYVKATIITINPLADTGVIQDPGTVCVGVPVDVMDTVAGGIWDIFGGHSFYNSGQIEGTSAGNDTLTYTVTNICGSLSAKLLVTINDWPDTGVISGTDNICAGSYTIFNETVSGGYWSVAGSHSVESGDTIYATDAGTDIVYYSVFNICGTLNATMPFTVNPLPDAGTIDVPGMVCVGTSIIASSSVAGGTWSVTGGNTTFSNDTVSGIAAGIDTLSYTYINSCGTDVASVQVTVNPQPVPGTVTGPSSVCAGSSIIFSDTATGGVWSISGGYSTLSNDTVTGISAGVDSITYSVTNVCGTLTATSVYTINPLPVAGTISGPDNFCVGSMNIYIDTASGGVWNLMGGHTVFNADTLTGMSAGVDTLSYSVGNMCGVQVAIRFITINPTPAISPLPSMAFCSGDRMDSVVFASTIPGTTFGWTNDNPSVGLPPIGDGTTPAFITATDTIGYNIANVTVIPTLGECSGVPATYSITVSPIPPRPSVALSTGAICAGAMYQNFGATAPVVGENYSWSATNAAVWAVGAGGQYCIINFSDSGNAVIMLDGYFPGYNCFSHDSMQVTVSGIQAVTPEVVYASGSFLCLRNDVDGYQWGYDDKTTLQPADITGEINQTFYCPSPDWANKYYYVKVTKNGCEQKVYANTPLSTNIVADSGKPSVFPNPTTGVINIALPNNEQNCSISVCDMYGKEIRLDAGSEYHVHAFSFDLGDIARGAYLLKIITPRKTYMEHLVLW